MRSSTATTHIAPYLDSVACEPLSRDEVRVLVQKTRDGDRKAHDKLVRAHLKLVPSTLGPMLRRNPQDAEATIQDGNVGLLLAIAKFDLDRGTALTTCAVPWIRAVAKYGIASRKSLVRRTRGSIRSDSSLDAMLSVGPPEGSSTAPYDELLHDESPSPELRLAQAEESAAVRGAIAIDDLGPRERDIVRRLASDEPETLQEIGDRYGISRERIRQIETKVKDDLRVQLSEFAPDAEQGQPETTKLATFSVVSVTSARAGRSADKRLAARGYR